ncbi:hypothetical protein HQN89_21935 [Paenibacillus frigoriresistens]|uniref:hypothetical protein n=1 Tax=Paenibacillus alginolyticus TaxID=59839 RepID=UPI00156411FE|nr:hypothetical protein [Paenibacillus frigoriresistens]NRF93608.1 hypothetical protein [Paenibacillus frigoriresistens]
MRDEEQQLVPYEQERELQRKYREAKERREQNKIKLIRDELVTFYVYYGESYKNSDTPDPRSAKWCLKKALELQKDHPIANYRYGHLMYADTEYALAAYHFKRAVDGSLEQCLSDTQRLIANIITVNCGLIMAKQAIQEVDEIEELYQDDPTDSAKREDYLSRMLVESEELLAQHMYLKVTPSGNEYISKERYLAEKETMKENEIKICVTPSYRVMLFQNWESQTISQTEFYVAHTILMSAAYLETKEIGEALKELEKVIKPEAIRKCLSRLSINVSFWDKIVDTNLKGNYSARRRRNGVKYSLLCHSSIVIP